MQVYILPTASAKQSQRRPHRSTYIYLPFFPIAAPRSDPPPHRSDAVCKSMQSAQTGGDLQAEFADERATTRFTQPKSCLCFANGRKTAAAKAHERVHEYDTRVHVQMDTIQTCTYKSTRCTCARINLDDAHVHV
jgi:hypothetical protein